MATIEYAGIDYRTVLKAVTDRLRADILAGRLGPGTRLNQDDVAKQLGVSRTPVREALRILESEGLIDRRPHRGAVVVNLRPEDILETFEIRAMLEAKACELAAPRLTDTTIARLHQIFDALNQADLDEDRWLDLNRSFHTTIYPASGWPRLCSLIEAQRNVVQPYLRASFAYLGRGPSAREEHARILAAAEDRDADRLARCTVEHLRTTAKGLIGFLSSSRASDGAQGAVAMGDVVSSPLEVADHVEL